MIEQLLHTAVEKALQSFTEQKAKYTDSKNT